MLDLLNILSACFNDQTGVSPSTKCVLLFPQYILTCFAQWKSTKTGS